LIKCVYNNLASLITSGLCCNSFNESRCYNARNNLRNILLWIIDKLPWLNSEHKICENCHKKIPRLKCDASNKQRNDDIDRFEHFAKITVMQSLMNVFNWLANHPSKQKDSVR
jgi:hypothetical protein